MENWYQHRILIFFLFHVSTKQKYRGYLSRQVVFRLAIDVSLLNSQRNVDFGKICRFYCFCGFLEKNWCFLIGSSLLTENYLLVFPIFKPKSTGFCRNSWGFFSTKSTDLMKKLAILKVNSIQNPRIFVKSADFTDCAIMRFRPLIK